MRVVVDSVGAVQDAVRAGPRVLPVGGATKPALSSALADGVTLLDVSALQGVIEYNPAEMTVTARAGTRIAALTDLLAEHDQYLPFDPPLGAAGATLGGVVAAGTSGPNAFRHGGVREFVIGVRFVDGTGRVRSGGGSVVKNAAGFDLPKLMVGSMGRLGVLIQLAFKVFPRPRATTTLIFESGSTEAGLDLVSRLARGPFEFEALDLAPPGRVLARIGGEPVALDARARRIDETVALPSQRLRGEEDAALWRAASDLAWSPAENDVIRVALTRHQVIGLEAALSAANARARYSLATNVAWVSWPPGADIIALDLSLKQLGLTGVVLVGPPREGLLGAARGGVFAARLRRALDPHDRFVSL